METASLPIDGGGLGMFDKIRARQEIEQRNRLRAEAHLPLVSVAEELVRYEKTAAQKEYRDFLSSPLRERVRESSSTGSGVVRRIPIGVQRVLCPPVHSMLQ